ncbi:MAG: hypothetical protein K2F97_09910 [Muribaculaceae bacterium]|nr:hypothetical protein [Muribaculaceae bacterium]
MKKIYLFPLFMLVALTFCACSNDKDEPEPVVGSQWIDPVFAQELQKRGYITNASTVTPSDVKHITKIDLSGTYDQRGSIKSLCGIEYFISLTYLDCSFNGLSSLDVSKNTLLTYLNCDANELSSLGL